MASQASRRVAKRWRETSSALRVPQKAFHVGVVVAVGAAAHARGDAAFLQQRGVAFAGVLNAAVAVVEQPGGGAAAVDGLRQGGLGQAGFQVFGTRQAEDAAAAKVEHSGHVEPAFLGPDIGAERSETASRRLPAKRVSEAKQMSATQIWFGSEGIGIFPSQFGAGSRPWALSVVHGLKRPRCTPRSPARCMSRAMRRCECLMPLARSSRASRGRP